MFTNFAENAISTGNTYHYFQIFALLDIMSQHIYNAYTNIIIAPSERDNL